MTSIAIGLCRFQSPGGKPVSIYGLLSVTTSIDRRFNSQVDGDKSIRKQIKAPQSMPPIGIQFLSSGQPPNDNDQRSFSFIFYDQLISLVNKAPLQLLLQHKTRDNAQGKCTGKPAGREISSASHRITSQSRDITHRITCLRRTIGAESHRFHRPRRCVHIVTTVSVDDVKIQRHSVQLGFSLSNRRLCNGVTQRADTPMEYQKNV